jgi:hypothetical protein
MKSTSAFLISGIILCTFIPALSLADQMPMSGAYDS